MNGSPGRTRTADSVVNSHLLYQLSYWGSVGARLKPSGVQSVKTVFAILRTRRAERRTMGRGDDVGAAEPEMLPQSRRDGTKR